MITKIFISICIDNHNTIMTFYVATWIMFFAFDMTSLVGTWDKAGATIVLLFAYGASAVPLSFIYSLGFNDHATTIVALSLVNFVTGFVLVNADFVLRNSERADVAAVGNTLAHVWRLFPRTTDERTNSGGEWSRFGAWI